MSRIAAKFQSLKEQKKSAFISYICAGDPNYDISLDILKSLPKAGVDLIELGVPFLDPAGDGPIIESASKRAVTNGMTLKKVIKMAKEFRKEDDQTPIILMTYYNPILKYGLKSVFKDAKKSGVDGFLIVDLPMEEEGEVVKYINQSNLDLIQLIAPTTGESRARQILKVGSGFIYLVSMLGITGTKSAKTKDNKPNLNYLRKISNLPIVIGFGIKTPEMAKDFAKVGFDGVVVGSEIVKNIAENFNSKKSAVQIASSAVDLARSFAKKMKQ